MKRAGVEHGLHVGFGEPVIGGIELRDIGLFLAVEGIDIRVRNGAVADLYNEMIASAEGRSVDTVAASETLLTFGLGQDRKPIEISFKPVPPDFTTEAARALGIQERISTFTTNFDPMK